MVVVDTHHLPTSRNTSPKVSWEPTSKGTAVEHMEKKVEFYSDGVKIAGVVYEPDDAPESGCPGIVLCQGMVGVKEYFWFPHIGRSLAALGSVALIWDFRGVGESGGEYGRLFPMEQAEDIQNALTVLETHPKVDPKRLGLLGFSFGGGMVPYVAGVDQRVMCSVSVAGWDDGERWMRRLRRTSEWLVLLERIRQDRRVRLQTGKSELLAQGEILVGDPSNVQAREAVISRIPGTEEYKSTAYSLATAEKLLEFRPVEVVHRIAPRAIFYVAAEHDALTPAQGILEMYRRTHDPKKLYVIPNAVHYDIYTPENQEMIMGMAADWFKEHLRF